MALDSKVLAELNEKGRASLFPFSAKIAVGMASCGLASGAESVFQSIQEQKAVFESRRETDKHGWEFVLAKTGCLGLCMQEPIVTVSRPRMANGSLLKCDAGKGQRDCHCLGR